MVEAYIKITTCAKCTYKSVSTSDYFEFYENMDEEGNLPENEEDWGKGYEPLEDWSCSKIGHKIVIGVDKMENDEPIPAWCPMTKEKILSRSLNNKLKKIKK